MFLHHRQIKDRTYPVIRGARSTYDQRIEVIRSMMGTVNTIQDGGYDDAYNQGCKGRR